MTLPATWDPPPDDLGLPPDEVHVWRAALDLPDPLAEALGRLLSADERERAERFHFARDRRRFSAGRGLLRDILSRYLNAAPQELRFHYNAHGKPSLYGSDLRFNLSHSGGLALFAVTVGGEVGVDVERIRPEVMQEGLARRYFSPREVTALEALPPEQQPPGFFNCWTRKEAYIKARGEGLSLPLDSFDVSLEPGKPARLLYVKDAPGEAERWSLWDLEVGAGFAAALALNSTGKTLRRWQYPV